MYHRGNGIRPAERCIIKTGKQNLAFYVDLDRSGFKTSDHARGQGAGRCESAEYTAVCEHFARPATPPSDVRRGFETTSNYCSALRHRPLCCFLKRRQKYESKKKQTVPRDVHCDSTPRSLPG